MNETGRAVKQIEQAISLDPSYAPAWTALGAVQFLGGRRERAGEAFRKAVALSPKSIEAHLALANYEWASGDTVAAETTLKTALALDQSNAAVHRTLALLYVTTKRAAEAEPHFGALVSEPGGRLALADYYTGMGNRDKALAVLHEVERGSEKADVRAARLRIACIEYATGNKADAHRILDDIIEEKPKSDEARVAKARMLLNDGKSDEAAAQAQEAVKANAGSVNAQYTLGLTALARDDAKSAEQAFQQVLKLNPRAGAARLQLARLQLARGETAGALSAAEEVARERPDDVEAAVLMSRSLRAQGELPRAQRELASRISRRPDVAPLRAEMGWVALQRRELASARASFEEALRLQPDLYEARVGLVTTDVAQRHVPEAQAQVATWLQQSPNDTRLKILSARLSVVGGKPADAERVLREVVGADASQLEAYDLLGRIYMSQGQADRALDEYTRLAERSKSPAGPLTMIGMIEESRANRDAARKNYERALQADARAGVAANNLAWIYADEGKLDEALKLATVAQEELRQRPEADDTLGWIYYRKALWGHAVPAFERAISRAPDNPIYHYHLGLAQLKAGNERAGRASLERALSLKADFNGADDARKLLASQSQ
jgi:tetratricopeptide (TPR) repeat protein